MQAAAQQISQPGLGERLGEKLGETRAAMIQAIQEDPDITTKTLAEKLHLSTTAIDKNLRFLRLRGHVKRIGPARGGHWQIMKRLTSASGRPT